MSGLLTNKPQDKHKRLNSAHGLEVTRLSQCHDNVNSLNSLWPIDVIYGDRDLVQHWPS